MRTPWNKLVLVSMALACAVACEVDVAPSGLRATPEGAGPRVVFDPNTSNGGGLPLPNDVATRPDPTSRTGRRPNLLVDGATTVARGMIADLDAMEGWGVNQPVSVTFARSATTDVRDPAIDVDAVFARMANDEHDPSNDPVYLVNLTTGIPVLLDVGAGDYPLTLRDPARGPYDRKGSEPNILFETVEEGAGLPFLDYTTALDRDFDGVLDHPNRYDWYERESDTLLLRPIVPLAEMTEYAVVLTDRLRAPNGEPVRSPFEAIHHPAQRAGVARLQDWLTDNRLAGYYGDIAGTGLAHVAFAWTFTTAPVRDDLRLLREGLYGRGVFARIGRDFPAILNVGATNPTTCLSTDPNVDRIVTGTFRSPKLLGDGPDDHFALDFTNGDGPYRSDDVPWVLVVPKARADHAAPFPVVVWAHDDGGSADDALVYGAAYARQGLAFLAFTREGATTCLGTTRGQSAPWWTGHVARDRDRLRQGAIDAINLVRILSTGNARDVDLGGGISIAGAGSGGIVASLAGATEPNVTATAPIASGGALADAALRSSRLDPTAVLGPWISAAPAAERPGSVCLPTQRSVRVGETEAACLNENELATHVTVLVTDVTTGVSRCGLTDRDGRFALALPMNAGDRLDVQIYDAPDSVGSFGDCRPKIGAPVGRRVETFEAGSSDRENAPALAATSAGLGLRRQSPELRRFRDLAQALLDPADPTAFAARFLLEPVETARPILATATIGDSDFPIASQLAFARAAGVLPFLPPSAVERVPAYADYATPRDFYDRLGARTPMRFLVESGVAEGIARLGKTSAGPKCATNDTCADPTGVTGADTNGCSTALFDPDWASERGLPYDAPHPDVPLRLARIAGPHVTDATTLAASWEPRLTGVPFAPDATGWTATRPVGALWSQYVVPNGAHAWTAESACKAWDPATYGNNLLARFFATNGSDLYYLSHPQSHGCLAKNACDLFK